MLPKATELASGEARIQTQFTSHSGLSSGLYDKCVPIHYSYN